MKWFRNRQQTTRRAPIRPSARPSVEALEDRNLLNASVAFDAAGNMATVVVFAPAAGSIDAGGNAYLFTSTGATLIGTNVRVAHVFRDVNGKIGFDIVYANSGGNPAAGGVAFEFDSTGSRTLGNNVLDASRAFDAKGNFVLDVIYAEPGSVAGSGNLFQYTNTSATFLGRNFYFASAFVDAKGVLGNAYGIRDTNSSAGPFFPTARAFVVDSTGARLLASGFFNGPASDQNSALQDYDQTTDPQGRAVVVVTSTNFSAGVPGQAGNAQEFSASGTTGFGAGNLQPF